MCRLSGVTTLIVVLAMGGVGVLLVPASPIGDEGGAIREAHRQADETQSARQAACPLVTTAPAEHA